MWRHLNKKGKNKVIYTNQTVVFSPPAWDEPKVRFWNKPPPPSSLINPLTSTLLLSLHVMTNCPPRHKKMLLPAEWCSLALSARPFRPLFLIYLCLFFLFSMKMIVPLSSADAAVIEKHTLLRPLSLSLSLPDSHWLPVRGDITLPFLPACLPPSSSSVPSHHSPHLTPCGFRPFLYCTPLSSPFSFHTVRIKGSSSSFYCSCIHLGSARHNNNRGNSLWLSSTCSPCTVSEANRLQGEITSIWGFVFVISTLHWAQLS